MDFFISNAIAIDNSSIQSQSSPYTLIVILLLFGLIFYFMILRPQHKRVKIHKELINSISEGDEVLTTGGLIGYVIKVTEDSEYICIAINNNNEVLIKKDFVTSVLPKGTIKALKIPIFK